MGLVLSLHVCVRSFLFMAHENSRNPGDVSEAYYKLLQGYEGSADVKTCSTIEKNDSKVLKNPCLHLLLLILSRMFCS